MGITIHYKGILKSPACIAPLTEEAKSIAELLQWPYHLLNDDDLNGIIINPPGSEPMFLSFSKEGRIAFPVCGPELEEQMFTKTQYAGMKTHIEIVQVFRYLSEKYFESFEMIDEGQFWETNDEEELRRIWARYEFAISSFSKALKNLPSISGESAESMVDRLEEYFRKNFRE